jgi:hypothetical protein
MLRRGRVDKTTEDRFAPGHSGGEARAIEAATALEPARRGCALEVAGRFKTGDERFDLRCKRAAQLPIGRAFLR